MRAGHVEDGPGCLLVQGGCPAVGEEDVVVSDLLLAPRHLALVHHRQVCNSEDDNEVSCSSRIYDALLIMSLLIKA